MLSFCNYKDVQVGFDGENGAIRKKIPTLKTYSVFVKRYDFFQEAWYKYLIVSLVFSHLGFWSGNLFLIAPFPDLCLLVPFYCDS